MKLSLSTVLVLAGVTVVSVSAGAAGSASPAPSTSQVVPAAPGSALLPALFVSAVKHQGVYASGALSMEVTLTNRSKVAVTQVHVEQMRAVVGANTKTSLFSVVDVPADGSVKVTFNDPDGLDSGCVDKEYTLLLGGAGSIDTRPRSVHAHPTCTFSGKIANPFWQMTPDHAEAEKNGKAYVDTIHFTGENTKIESALTCGKAVHVEGFVNNQTKKNGNNVFFTLTAPDGKTSAASVGPLAIASGQAKTFSMMNGFTGHAGVHAFKVVDVNASLGAGGVVNQGLTMTVSRSCTVDMVLEK